jgi:hypothetical protein
MQDSTQIFGLLGVKFLFFFPFFCEPLLDNCGSPPASEEKEGFWQPYNKSTRFPKTLARYHHNVWRFPKCSGSKLTHVHGSVNLLSDCRSWSIGFRIWLKRATTASACGPCRVLSFGTQPDRTLPCQISTWGKSPKHPLIWNGLGTCCTSKSHVYTCGCATTRIYFVLPLVAAARHTVSFTRLRGVKTTGSNFMKPITHS